jgi:hypothetical protein
LLSVTSSTIGNSGATVSSGSSGGAVPTVTFAGFTNSANYGAGGSSTVAGGNGFVMLRHAASLNRLTIAGGAISTDTNYVYYTFTSTSILGRLLA